MLLAKPGAAAFPRRHDQHRPFPLQPRRRRLGRHQFDEAAGLLHESLLLSYELGDQEDIVWCLVALGTVANEYGASRDAALLLQTALGMLAGIGASMKPFEQRLFDQTRAAIRDNAGPHLDDVPALP